MKKEGTNWIVTDITSSDYGVTLGWEWNQQSFTQSTSGNEIIVDVYGFIDYNILIDGLGTLYKKKQHYQLKINSQTGKITYLAKK
ncbi:hypothetical protein ACQ33O_06880 [Ferruginibacter sp. SUN002]|uniref:hypothetical protein n=1 Tax=Ferruginibacter sp. SUN002 TaxID=2937789 RepID=UPI003D35EFBF